VIYQKKLLIDSNLLNNLTWLNFQVQERTQQLQEDWSSLLKKIYKYVRKKVSSNILVVNLDKNKNKK